MRIWVCLQVKDVLFEPVRKTQDAMHFKKVTTKEGEEMWMPCGPREPNAKQTTMIELASAGLAAQVNKAPTLEHSNFLYSFVRY
jgi:vacuolar protein-sorting-associated protein 4